MKKVFLFFVLTVSTSTFLSCSSDDNSSNSTNKLEQKLLGKWYFNPPTENYEPNSFTFNSDHTVKYSSWASPGDDRGETGTWSMNGDILRMEYPEAFLIVYVQKVIFIDDNTVQFVKVEGSTEEPYEGTYYRAK